jgi:nicotinamidase-related amidase
MEETVALLASNSHPNLLHPDQSLLVVVDMQEPLLRALHDSERVVDNVRRLIQGASVVRVPVITTTQNADKLGAVAPQIKALLPPTLLPLDKMTFSCYASPSFASEVKRSDRKQIVLCGVEAHICVCQTALELAAAGFQVHVAGDATSSRTEANWRLGLDKMRQSGVLLTSVEMALYEWLREAGTPEFREILKLVK